MNIRVSLATIAAVCTLSTASVAADGNPTEGEEIFKACRACHQVGPDAKNALGPVLNGIVGRKAGSVEGFNYSPANKDARRGANATVSVDLETQEIRGPDGGVIGFDIDPHRKHCLLNGLDDIGLTMQKEKAIKSYEDKVAQDRPWM